MGIALLLLVCAVFNAVFVYLDYSAAGSFSGMSLFHAHSAAFAASAEAAYEERRKNTDVDSHPLLVRLADFVAGRKDEAAKAEGSRQ